VIPVTNLISLTFSFTSMPLAFESHEGKKSGRGRGGEEKKNWDHPCDRPNNSVDGVDAVYERAVAKGGGKRKREEKTAGLHSLNLSLLSQSGAS